MSTSAETGRLLEQRVAEFFRSHGYAATCNEIIEGRSGGRHEVDVLAEKSDSLTTYRVAVECKAWQTPIEKDVVTKLHYILGDLGLHKGIIVCLAGSRSGAKRTASDLGLELWGPEEIRKHLGDAAFAELDVPDSTNMTMSLGQDFVAPALQAEKAIARSRIGRWSFGATEEVTWFAPVWLPAYCVTLTITQPERKRGRTKLRAMELNNLYDALGGRYLGSVSGDWERIEMPDRGALRPALRDTKVHAALRKAEQGYQKVTSEAAIQRHIAKLRDLGIPAPVRSTSIDATALVYLPFYLGILVNDSGQRVVAVDGVSGVVSDEVTELLTANLSLVREQLG